MGSQEYDIALKSLITEGGAEVIDFLTGSGRSVTWLNVELAEVRSPRVDLLARVAEGDLLQVELQSTNDMTPRRMEYLAAIWSKVVLYVGKERLRIARGHKRHGLRYQYEVVDIRTLDGEAMLPTGSLALWVMSVLAKQSSPGEAVGEVIMRITQEPDTARRVSALKHLFLLAGLRGLEEEVKERSQKVPIAADIMDHKVLGPALRKSPGKKVSTRDARRAR